MRMDDGAIARFRRGPRVHDPVLLLLASVAIVACVGIGFLSHAPNRLADGVVYPIWGAPAWPARGVGLCLAGLVGLAFAPLTPRRATLVLALAVGLAFATVAAAGLFAFALIEPDHLAQRQALGPAFWILIATSSLTMLEAMDAMALRLAWRVVFVLALIVAGVISTTFGVFDGLSLAREAASHRALLAAAFARHVELVAASVILSVFACIPLVWIARRSARLRGPVFAGLGLLQTIPSIALFGLLIAPLGFLAAHVPGLRALGVSGLGVTPTLIALVLYSAFPLVRMSDAAFSAVPAEVMDAARGLGYGRGRRFVAVDLPLALPVLISGLRVVTVQAIGLATIAALIGGGGLGTFVFEGIGQYALDLVLLGAIPVILLALAADFLFRLVLAAVRVPA